MMYDSQVLYKSFVYDILATLLVYLLSFLTDNSTWYDPYWSVAPPVLLVYFISNSIGEAVAYRQILISCLVVCWSVRLTYNWVVGFLRQSGATAQHGQDWRYIELQEKHKKMRLKFLYWPVTSLFGIHLLPTVLVFLGCCSVHVAVHDSNEQLNVVDVLGGVVTAIAIVIETVADEQLRSFSKRNTSPNGAPSNSVLQTGLWRYSRHPNYFGEALFWMGLYIIAVGAAPQEWAWLSVGPIGMLALFIVISIPMMEERQAKKRPEYRNYQAKTSKFIPWFRGK